MSLLTGGTYLYLHTTVLDPVETAGYQLVSFVSATSDSYVKADLTPVDTVLAVPQAQAVSEPTANTIPYIVKDSKKSVYEIRTVRATGSGFMIRSGLIVTNHHVVQDSGGVVTLTNLATGTTTQGRVLNVQTDGNDIAYIQVDDLSLQPLKVGSSTALMEGESVIAIGSPIGLTGTVTVGVLSAKHRELSGHQFIQHDAAISPGNSGGPVIDGKGGVVGMTTLSMNSQDKSYQNINMAVPIELITRYAPQ
jgi:S1-C subfamily serine protease